MKAATVVIGILGSLTAAGAEPVDKHPQPSVEILGVKIERGMPEAAVRATFPDIYCAEKAPGANSNVDYCSVSDDVPPGADGEFTFKDGVVRSASRNWFIPAGAEPFEVLMMLNGILSRLTDEPHATCAKIETHSDQEPTYTIFALPEKVLTVQMHTLPGRKSVHFRESLRVNPVPDHYKTRGRKNQGTEWCAYAG